jgi:citrate synthase
MVDVNLDRNRQHEAAMAWLTREQALAVLGTKPQSLYASVSRGRVRARQDPADPRRSLYARDDVMRLAARAAGRRQSSAIASEAIRWGDPVLESAITTIAGERPYYRGVDAIALAETASLETAAARLWQVETVRFDVGGGAGAAAGGAPSLARAFAALAEPAAQALPVLGRAPRSLLPEAAGLVATLAAAFGAAGGTAPLHQRLALGWNVPDAQDALRRGLVLLADHELNASTFAARVAASTGASLAAALLCGLATLTGPLHGAASAGIVALVAAAEQVGAPDAARSWLAQGRPLPGFGHRLYPGGDPRAGALLSGLVLPPVYAAVAEAAGELTGEAPNVDFALAALAEIHRLPPGAPLALFAIARSVGWLAHAMEQAASGTLIRPRARYVGPAVGVAG